MMASSSRPHRQARSGVSYRDAFYEYNDDFCKPQPNTTSRKSSSSRNDGKGPARKNLALKGTSRSKDRANAKERAEAVHLQRAINESLSKSSPEAINLSSDHEKDILDYEDETTSKDCVAFQCLLDVASEAVLKGDGHVHKSPRVDEGIAKKQHEGNQILEPPSRPLHGGELAKQVAGGEVNVEGGKCKESYQAEDQLKIVFKEDADSSYEGEEEDDTDIDAEEESSDLSEESGCKRKRPVKSQQKGKKAANKHNIDNIYTVQVKKARSIRPLSKVEASSTGNSRTSPPSLCKEQTLQHVKAPGGKENIATSHSSLISKATKNSVLNLKQQIVAGGEANMSSCQSVVESEGPRSLVFDSTSPGSPGIANFQAHSPTFLHRRVIGLSRRFRPPPLHPYLSKTER